MFWVHVIYISVIVILFAAIVGLLLMRIKEPEKEIANYEITDTGISAKVQKPPVPRYTFKGAIQGGHTFTVLGFSDCPIEEIMQYMDETLDDNFEDA